MKGASKSFFLISFLPAIAYWYLESYYPIRIAVAGGVLLAVLELSAEKIFVGHLHALSKFNFWLILGLGGISLIGDEGIWFKLQPAFTGIGIGSYLFYKTFRGNGLMLEMLESMGKQSNLLPPEMLTTIEKHMAVFFFGYGIFMAFIATLTKTDTWLFYKTIGFYCVFAVFMVFELIFIRILIARMITRQKKAQIFARF
jgi:intracellular septation protein